MCIAQSWMVASIGLGVVPWSPKYDTGNPRCCASPSNVAECRTKPGWPAKSEHRGSWGPVGRRWACRCWRRRLRVKLGQLWCGQCTMEMSLLCWLFDPSWGGERLHGGEVVIPGEWRGIPVMSRGGSTRSGSTTEEYSGTRRWLDGRVKVRTGYNWFGTSSSRWNSQWTRKRSPKDMFLIRNRGICLPSSLASRYPAWVWHWRSKGITKRLKTGWTLLCSPRGHERKTVQRLQGGLQPTCDSRSNLCRSKGRRCIVHMRLSARPRRYKKAWRHTGSEQDAPRRSKRERKATSMTELAPFVEQYKPRPKPRTAWRVACRIGRVMRWSTCERRRSWLRRGNRTANERASVRTQWGDFGRAATMNTIWPPDMMCCVLLCFVVFCCVLNQGWVTSFNLKTCLCESCELLASYLAVCCGHLENTCRVFRQIVPHLISSFSSLSTDRHSSVVQYTVWLLYAYTLLGSNRPWVFNRVFIENSVIMTSHMVADTSLKHLEKWRKDVPPSHPPWSYRRPSRRDQSVKHESEKIFNFRNFFLRT